MALYHMHVDIIGRSSGKSAVGSVGYQFRMNVVDETTGEKMYYAKKSDKAIRLGFDCPKDCAEQFVCRTKKDVANFWNEVQKKENRKNSQFARDFDIALQLEFSVEQNQECIEKWLYENYTKRGLCSSYAIHGPHKNPDGTINNNWHVHVMVALRKVDQNGWAEKDREGNDREFLKKVRKSWADIVNAKFKELGIAEHIDERTLEEQGIDREPQQHKGPSKTAIERKNKSVQKEIEPNRTAQKYRDKKQLQKEIENINIPENAIINELKNDAEYRRLEELRRQIFEEIEKKRLEEKQKNEELEKAYNRIESMTPKQWREFMKGYGENWNYDACGEYAKMTRDAYDKATAIYVEQNYEPVRKYFYDWALPKVQALKKYDNQNPKPWNDAKMDRGFFRGEDWYTSDGKHFGNDPGNARCHQQQLRGTWTREREPLKKSADDARNQWKAVEEKNYPEIVSNLKRYEHHNFMETLRDGIAKVFRESPILAPVRAVVGAVNKLRHRKDAELSAWNQEQQELRKNQKGQKYNGPSRS